MKIFQIFLTTILFSLFFMGYSGTVDLLLILGYSGLILITIGIENKPTPEDASKEAKLARNHRSHYHRRDLHLLFNPIFPMKKLLILGLIFTSLQARTTPPINLKGLKFSTNTLTLDGEKLPIIKIQVGLRSDNNSLLFHTPKGIVWFHQGGYGLYQSNKNQFFRQL